MNQKLGWVLLIFFNIALASVFPLGYASFYMIVTEGIRLAYLLILVVCIYVTVSVVALDVLVWLRGISYFVSIFKRRCRL